MIGVLWYRWQICVVSYTIHFIQAKYSEICFVIFDKKPNRNSGQDESMCALKASDRLSLTRVSVLLFLQFLSDVSLSGLEAHVNLYSIEARMS